jgi:hypothetical protein
MSSRARQCGHEQPGECSGDAMMVSGGGAPLLAAWLGPGLDPRTGSGRVLFGWKPLSTLNAQPPELKRGVMTHGPTRVPPCHKTANQVRPWPPQAAS